MKAKYNGVSPKFVIYMSERTTRIPPLRTNVAAPPPPFPDSGIVISVLKLT